MPDGSPATDGSQAPLRRFSVTLQPGESEYAVVHGFATENVMVQTRIAGRVREGGISIADGNVVKVMFGGVLNEPMDVVIIG